MCVCVNISAEPPHRRAEITMTMETVVTAFQLRAQNFNQKMIDANEVTVSFCAVCLAHKPTACVRMQNVIIFHFTTR